MNALVSLLLTPSEHVPAIPSQAGGKRNPFLKNSLTCQGVVRAVGLEPTRAFRPSAF